jgi:hypothetical protein
VTDPIFCTVTVVGRISPASPEFGAYTFVTDTVGSTTSRLAGPAFFDDEPYATVTFEFLTVHAILAPLFWRTASVRIVIPDPAHIPVLFTSPREKVILLSGPIVIFVSVCDDIPSNKRTPERNFIPTGRDCVIVNPVNVDSGMLTTVSYVTRSPIATSASDPLINTLVVSARSVAVSVCVMPRS